MYIVPSVLQFDKLYYDGRMDRYIQGNTPPIIRLVGIIEPVSRDPKFTIIVQQFSILLNY